jgi:hypothetical protein
VWKLYFYFATVQRICLSIDGFYSESTQTVYILAITWCMDMCVHACVCVWGGGFFLS